MKKATNTTITAITLILLAGCATHLTEPVPAIIFDLETDKVIVQSEDSTTPESILKAAEGGCAIHNRKASEPINTKSECIEYGSSGGWCIRRAQGPCIEWWTIGYSARCIRHANGPCIQHSSITEYCEKSVSKTLFACIEVTTTNNH